jgi:carboxypeptidase Taq
MYLHSAREALAAGSFDDCIAGMSHPSCAVLISQLKRADVHASVLGLLQWDEQVNLPPDSGDRRAGQLALLAELHHRATTDPAIGRLLVSLEAGVAELTADEKVIVRHARRDYDRATKLPPEFVAAKAALESEAFHAWREARATSDFAKFAPFLVRQVETARREAEYVGWGDRPYDYCIDRHDPGMNSDQISILFDELKRSLLPVMRKITAAAAAAPAPVALRGFPQAGQQTFLREVTSALGFNYCRGRIDTAVHPFCSGDAADTRMTTRFNEDDPLDALFSSIHETGHGLYEQGLPLEHLGTPLGQAVGMAIHESQSRLWENQVGRSRGFWRYFEPKLRAVFPAQLSSVSSEQLYLAINEVRPSLIRVDADEVTYNLHILLRFELEQRLFSGDLAVHNLPAAWNELCRSLLGLVPANDAQGVLQDVHWSGGAFGYFPSYCLGNMIAAQLWAAARRSLPGLEEDFSQGNFRRLLAWLRQRIHHLGRRHDTRELVREVTGEAISPIHLVNYLEERYGEIYLPATR